MIIKKPYAFLIKHFRLIHGLLFVLLTYILFQNMEISTFFNQYAKNQYYNRLANLTSMYVNYYNFITILLAMGISAVIAAILKLKQKNIKSYVYMFISLAITFVYNIYMFSVFNELEISGLQIESVRNLRDISLIILIPQMVFVFIMFGRTLGFNLKQFDFKKDLEELDISDTDNEEVEVILGNNNYKYIRFLRKSIRLTKYFILENKFFVIGVASILALGLSLSIFMSINVYSVDYTENQQVVANSLLYKVNKSYITQYDIKNKKINSNKSYVLVEIEVDNQFDKEYKLTRETFRLNVNGEMLIPIFTLSEKFLDIGTPFVPCKILGKEKKSYIVIFEIDKDYESVDYIFKIKNYDSKSFKEIETRYKDIIIKPNNLDKLTDEGKYNLPANINFEKSILKKSKLEIINYEIAEKFKEEMQYCIKDKCDKGIFVITPNMSENVNLAVMRIESKIELDNSIIANEFISTSDDLFEKYGYLSYTFQGYEKNVSIKKINTNHKKENVAYMQVPIEVKSATNLKLIINIRGKKYTINLTNTLK